MQQADTVVEVFNQRVLGQLQLQAGGVALRGCHRMVVLPRDEAAPQLPSRDVDRDVQLRQATALPVGQLHRRLLQHPTAEFHDQARALGHVDEVAGHQQAALGVLPAQQGFCSQDAARAQLHNGLVGQPHLAFTQGAAQLGFELDAVLGGQTQALSKHHQVAFAARLGLVHGDVRGPHHVLGRLAIEWKARHAHGPGEVEFMAVQASQARQRTLHHATIARRVGKACIARADHHELIAAKAVGPSPGAQ